MDDAIALPEFPLFDVDDVEVAFGSEIGRYYGGSYEDGKRASCDIRRALRAEAEVFSALFYRGESLADQGLKWKDGTDHKKAMRCLRALMGSWAPSHEQKVATVALALHHWAEPIAQGMAARSDETPPAAQPEGQQPGSEGMRPNTVSVSEQPQ